MDLRNEKYQKVVDIYERKQQAIISKALEVLSSYSPMIETASQLFSEIDVLLRYIYIYICIYLSIYLRILIILYDTLYI